MIIHARNPVRQLMVALPLLLASTFSFGAASEASINQVLELSGLTEQVQQIPEAIKAGLHQAHQKDAPIPENEFQNMLTSADEAFNPDQIMAELRTSLGKSLNEEQAQELLTWYQSDLGKEITQAEEAASTPEAYQQLAQAAPALMADQEKMAFSKRLDNLMGATDMTIGLQKHSTLAVYSAMMAATQPDVKPDTSQIERQMDATLQQNRGGIEQMVQVSLAFAYRDLDMAKLEKYEAFLNRPASTTFNRTVMKNMDIALRNAISDWAQRIAAN